MKTIYMAAQVSAPIIKLPQAVAENLNLPEFIHGNLVSEKSVSIADEKAAASTAKIEIPRTEAVRSTAKTSQGRNGRPKAKIDVKTAFHLQREGKTMREIQQTLNCGLRTLERALSRFKRNRWEF